MRLYRAVTDSRQLERPRVLTRVFTDEDRLEQTVRFYESLTGAALDQDLDVAEQGLHIVAVGEFLILALDDSRLDRAPRARQTQVTVIVPELDLVLTDRVARGAEVVDEPVEVPTGRGARLRHPDGVLVEYLEHRPSPADVERPGL